MRTRTPALIGAGLALMAGAVLWSGIVPHPFDFHAVLLAAIAAVYVGFALTDGRLRLVFLETGAAVGFLALVLVGLVGSPMLLALGFMLHGFWDLMHHPKRGIETRLPEWYPPFCAAYDFVHAAFFLLLGITVAAPTG